MLGGSSILGTPPDCQPENKNKKNKHKSAIDQPYKPFITIIGYDSSQSSTTKIGVIYVN